MACHVLPMFHGMGVLQLATTVRVQFIVERFVFPRSSFLTRPYLGVLRPCHRRVQTVIPGGHTHPD